MKRVCFVPAVSKNNRYVELMRNAIKYAGYDLSETNSLIDIVQCDIVHFNWFESVPSNHPMMKYLTYIWKMIMLLLLKASGKEIFFTFHNKVQHEEKGGNLSFNIMKWLINNSDGVVIHCESSRNVLNEISPNINLKKALYVPHPNYIDVYPDNKMYSGYKKSKGELLFLFMGQVRPYKNLETVIEASNQLAQYKDITFLICGKCYSEQYRKELLVKSNNRNMHFDLRFINDGEIPSLMSMADCVLLPYNTRSALNSGAAYLAFSYGKTVVSTEIGTVIDMMQRDLVYGYKYSEVFNEDVLNLKETILKIYFEYMDNPHSIENKGRELYKIMQEENSVDAIAEKISALYR